MYQWRQLENLYFREKKFSVEIHDQRKSNAPSQSGKGAGGRTFGPSNVNVHVWFAATPTLCKTIWSMAICQHQFYLDRKTTKVGVTMVLHGRRYTSTLIGWILRNLANLFLFFK